VILGSHRKMRGPSRIWEGAQPLLASSGPEGLVASLLGLVTIRLPGPVLLLRDPNLMMKIEGLVGCGSVQHSPMLLRKVVGCCVEPSLVLSLVLSNHSTLCHQDGGVDLWGEKIW